MEFITYIKGAIGSLQDAIIARLPIDKVVKEYNIRAESRKSGATVAEYKRMATVMREKDLDDWKIAVMSATDPDDPRRALLHTFYQSLLIDEHLQTTIDHRVLALQQSEFILEDKDGKENKEAKELLDRPWFHDLIRIFFMHRMQGVSLVNLSHLNDEMEISHVEEIPMSNYIPQRGIIVREQGDTTGWSYVDGKLTPYFLQFGNAWSLGILNELAIIIMAKKLGMGSWMNNIEKYGVPPIFIITERMDKKRIDEIASAMSDFHSSQFMVLGGNEKVEIGKETTGNTTNAFDPLLERCDRQVTKRLLGQTSTTENGSFVGTAEVHERVEARFRESDKMLFRHYFNSFIKQRLVKISPVYGALENLKLRWDDTESLDINAYIQAVKDLSPYVEFDIEEIAKKTGLPIVAIRKFMNEKEGDDNPKPGGRKGKKKEQGDDEEDESDASAQAGEKSSSPVATTNMQSIINKLYYIDEPPVASSKFSLSEKVRKKVLERLAQNGFDIEKDIDIDLFDQTFKPLKGAIEKGLGTPEFGTPDRKFLRELEHNAAVFAAFKTHRQQKELHAMLFDEKGNKKSFDEFRRDTQNILNNYNVNWLQTEYETAVTRARFARDYREFEANKDLYPNLEWLPSTSAHPREAHKPFYHTIHPVGSDFFKEHFPGSVWRCQCSVRATSEPVSDDVHRTRQQPADGLDGNPADGILFSESHPYISASDKQTKAVVNDFVEKYEASVNMPKELLPDSEYLKGTGIRMEKAFFDLLDRDKKIELVYNKKISGTGKTGFLPDGEGGGTVFIKNSTAFENSLWLREKTPYHEFGHAIDTQRKLHKDAELLDIIKKHKQLLMKKVDYKDANGNTIKISQLQLIDEKLKDLRDELELLPDNDKRFNKKTRADYNAQIVATRDVIMALDINSGDGHEKEYYKIKGNSEKEIIAHAFEFVYAGNGIFKKYLPQFSRSLKNYILQLKPL